jgi:S1-C subfamily serine protease
VPPAGSLVLSVSRTASGTVSTGVGVITSAGGPLRTARGVVLPAIIRTDAALRPGTAGGALVDAHGHIIGLTTPGLMRGLPVAVPAVEAFELARRLAARQPLGRGYLGVSVQAVRLGRRQQEAAPDGRGLLVVGVSPEGAADRAGLLVGDVLLHFGDHPLRDAEDLQDALSAVRPDTSVTVQLLRGAEPQRLDMTVGERPPA